jgi:hypothetical protein
MSLLWEVAAVNAEDAGGITEKPSGLFFVTTGQEGLVPAHGADELLKAGDAGFAEGSQSDGFHRFPIQSAEKALEIRGAERWVLGAAPTIAKEAVEDIEFFEHRVEVRGSDIDGGRCFGSEKEGHGFFSWSLWGNPAVGEGRKVGTMDA